ncbi:MAG: transposase [Methylocapsa sp.]|nr:transposase [Methylocapsa sp.]
MAGPRGERTGGRPGYRPGFSTQGLVTRLGKIELRIPQDRQERVSAGLFRRSTRAPAKRCSRRRRRCMFRALRRGK